MYNTERKNEFIKEYTRMSIEYTQSAIENVFEKISEFEYKLYKDCSCFGKDDILQMYSALAFKAFPTIKRYNNILSMYCLFISDGENNPYGDISLEELKKCLEKNEKIYYSREQMDIYESELLNDTDRAIVECIWEGLWGHRGLDIVNVERKYIDFDNNIIQYPNGQPIRISDNLGKLLKSAFLETDYLGYGKSRTRNMHNPDMLYELSSNSYKSKMDCNNVDDKQAIERKYRWLQRKLIVFSKHLNDKNFKIDTIRFSGFLHYATIGKQKGNFPSYFVFLYNEEGQKLLKKYGYKEGVSNISTLCRKIKMYLGEN